MDGKMSRLSESKRDVGVGGVGVVGVEDRGWEESVWVKGCLINLKQVQWSLQNANETISLIGEMEGTVGGGVRGGRVSGGNA